MNFKTKRFLITTTICRIQVLSSSSSSRSQGFVVMPDRRGSIQRCATSFLHLSRSSQLLIASLNLIFVHSDTLSSHLFLCLPLLREPRTVPCRTSLARPCDLVTCPYHFSFLRLTRLIRSIYGPIAFVTLLLTSSLVT